MKDHIEWARFPSEWVGESLRNFRVADPGALHALKLYLSLALYIPRHAWLDGTGQAEAFPVTYEKWQELSGLDRSSISFGLKTLKQNKLFNIDSQIGRKSSYQLTGDIRKGYARIPLTLTKARLKYFGMTGTIEQYERRPLALDSLKLYVLLLAFRNSATNRSVITYDKITSYSDIKRARIHPALSFLAAMDLIVVEHLPLTTLQGESRVMNSYFIKDLALYRPMPERKISEEQWTQANVA